MRHGDASIPPSSVHGTRVSSSSAFDAVAAASRYAKKTHGQKHATLLGGKKKHADLPQTHAMLSNKNRDQLLISPKHTLLSGGEKKKNHKKMKILHGTLGGKKHADLPETRATRSMEHSAAEQYLLFSPIGPRTPHLAQLLLRFLQAAQVHQTHPWRRLVCRRLSRSWFCLCVVWVGSVIGVLLGCCLKIGCRLLIFVGCEIWCWFYFVRIQKAAFVALPGIAATVSLAK